MKSFYKVIFLISILLFAKMSFSQCTKQSFHNDIQAVLDFGVHNINQETVEDNAEYYKNYLELLKKSQHLVYKYQNCENAFYKYCSIYFHQNLISRLQLKGSFEKTKTGYSINDNLYKIDYDSISWHTFKFEKYIVTPIYDLIDFKEPCAKNVDTNLIADKYFSYFITDFNFIAFRPKKAIWNDITLTQLNELSTTYENDNTKKFLIAIIIITIFCIGLIVYSRFQLKVNKKQNKLITEQKSALEHQKQEITDSINYSKRIQTAILPDLNDIKHSLTDFFILYQPKDIVSGDFYYFNEVNNDVFIAAADCTGHGVPGAFMSLVGSKELKIANAISNSPAQILKHLNNGVKDTLRQNHIDGTKDGMDIALVRINGTTVTYSAANRPLWILKKDSAIIEEIKANKTAIAGFTEDNFEFDEHEINLAKGDTIYLFSDGYADQFGGDKQKKMTTKRFREFLLSIKDKSMNEQQLELQCFFNSWQGNTEQVDDLLIIGIRL